MTILGSIVLIKPDHLPEKTKRGLYIPATAKELPQTGTIMDCGPACKDAKKGMRVIFPRKSASAIIIDDIDYYLIPEGRVTYKAGEGETVEVKPKYFGT